MKIIIIIIIILLIIAGLFFVANKTLLNKNNLNKNNNNNEKEVKELSEKNKMEIKSVFKNGERIPDKYTADGNDVNPSLEILGVPENAKSLILITDDPDAPRGTWVHWIVWNIPANTRKIEENSIPQNSIQGKNSWGRNNYGGPSPPSGNGAHRYFFKLYALDTQLSLSENSDKIAVENAMSGHILNKAELMGVYSRDLL